MRKIISCILTLSVIFTIVFGGACRVQSVSGTVTTTRTTGPSGTSRTTTIGGTIVLTPLYLTTLSGGDFYIVADLAEGWQIDTGSPLPPKLEVTKQSANGQLSTASFDMIPDTSASVSNVDKTTNPFVYKVSDVNAFSSFMAAGGNLQEQDEEMSYSFSFPTTQVDCNLSGDYLNHVRLGSGSEIVYLGAFTYRVTPSLIATCDDDIEIVDISTGGKSSINDFVDSLF